MNPFAAPDRAADTFAARHMADLSYDQSQRNHSLIVGLVGMAYALADAVIYGPSLFVFTKPLAIGLLLGVGAYVLRELWTRAQLGFSYEIWDGALDVLEPCRAHVAWSLAALSGVVPWWTGALVCLFTLLNGGLYTIWRPRGKFLYIAARVEAARLILQSYAREIRESPTSFPATNLTQAAQIEAVARDLQTLTTPV